MVANMWKNSAKNLESDNNKILYETLLDCFLQRNGTYCLNKRRNTAYAHYMLDNQGHKHTLSIRNTYCFSTANINTRTRLNITSYALYLSCPLYLYGHVTDKRLFM